jgi:DNA-binding NarL/FixJ family response regulator
VATPGSLVVVGAEPLTGKALASLLQATFTVVAVVTSFEETVCVLRQHDPDVCLLLAEPTLPATGGDDAVARLCKVVPATRTLVLFRRGTYQYLTEARRRGCRGFFDTSAEPDELVRGLEKVRSGEVAVHAALLPYLLEVGGSPEGHGAVALTDSQLRTLTLLAEGCTSKEIARLTGTSTHAVNHIIERATQRLSANHRTHAVARAMQLGLLPVGRRSA